DDANKHLDKFLHVTQIIKVNGVTDDALRLYLFPHSLTRHATAWFDRLPKNSINTFEQMAKMFLSKYFPPSMKVKESLNVAFDETPPPSETSPLVDDDLDEEEAIKVIEKKNLENDIADETLEIDERVNIKESIRKCHMKP
nr:reverse transcriptase domain-containing protein [Tanacetum cinerariifolium]